MALLDYVTNESAEEDLRDYFDQSWYDDDGFHFRRIRLHNPAIVDAQDAFKESVMSCGIVDEELFEIIMVAVAEANDCTYCAGTHRTFLAEQSQLSTGDIADISNGDYGALPERAREVARFAAKATETPNRMVEDDIEALREVRFSDSDVIQLLGVIGHCHVCNLIASTLKISEDDPIS